MTDKQKKVLYRIIATALLYAVLLVMEHIVKPAFMEQWYVTLVLFLIPYFVIGWDIMYKAVRNISHGQVFDENFLMLIADRKSTRLNSSHSSQSRMPSSA